MTVVIINHFSNWNKAEKYILDGKTFEKMNTDKISSKLFLKRANKKWINITKPLTKINKSLKLKLKIQKQKLIKNINKCYNSI